MRRACESLPYSAIVATRGVLSSVFVAAGDGVSSAGDLSALAVTLAARLRSVDLPLTDGERAMLGELLDRLM